MKLYTSYYASKLIAPSGLVPVRTSLGHPRWKLPYDLSERCPLLMPMRSMLGLEEAAYRERYRELLDHRGLDQIAAELVAISDKHGGADLVLCCFESLRKPCEFCHRRMAASLIEERTGLAVPELGGLPPAQGRPAAQQGRLF